MLFDRDSTVLHLSLARRHERLARRYQQNVLAAAILAATNGLKTKHELAGDRELDRQSAYDGVLAADGDLDDGFRGLFNSAENYDRDNVGARTLALLFPEGGFGSIIDQPLAQEPSTAEAMATKVEGLEAGHPLAPHAAKLRTLAAGVREALTALDTAVRVQKSAEAEEELAQGVLRRQYEANYLDARKALGRTIAERLFPRARTAGEAPPAAPPA